jgi:hypothetical protein
VSYALGAAPPRAIEVGARAYGDPILARASLDAARAMKAAVQSPGQLRRRLLKYGPGSEAAFERELARLKAKGKAQLQANFDAFRLVAANYYTGLGMQWLKSALGPEALGALGEEDVGKMVGCGIGGGATAILSAVVGAYTAGVGAPIVGAGGGIAMAAAGCGQSAGATQQQAAEAQRQAQEAARLAAEQERQAAERRKTYRLAGGLGLLSLVVLGTGYAIWKA